MGSDMGEGYEPRAGNYKIFNSNLVVSLIYINSIMLFLFLKKNKKTRQ